MKDTGVGLVSVRLWGRILPLVRLAAEIKCVSAALVGVQGDRWLMRPNCLTDSRSATSLAETLHDLGLR
jgi:hypothetical protein